MGQESRPRWDCTTHICWPRCCSWPVASVLWHLCGRIRPCRSSLRLTRQVDNATGRRMQGDTVHHLLPVPPLALLVVAVLLLLAFSETQHDLLLAQNVIRSCPGSSASWPQTRHLSEPRTHAVLQAALAAQVCHQSWRQTVLVQQPVVEGELAAGTPGEAERPADTPVGAEQVAGRPVAVAVAADLQSVLFA